MSRGRTYLAVFMTIWAIPAAAQTYRWVDEHGVTNYGPKPPAGRPAQPVDTRPRNTIDTAPVPKVEREARRKAVAPQLPPPPGPPPVAVRGMAFDTYVRLQRGMSEGELRTRAGHPDYVALEQRDDVVKSFYYYPTTGDPFTTVVTLRSGRIDNIERTKRY